MHSLLLLVAVYAACALDAQPSLADAVSLRLISLRAAPISTILTYALTPAEKALIRAERIDFGTPERIREAHISLENLELQRELQDKTSQRWYAQTVICIGLALLWAGLNCFPATHPITAVLVVSGIVITVGCSLIYVITL